MSDQAKDDESPQSPEFVLLMKLTFGHPFVAAGALIVGLWVGTALFSRLMLSEAAAGTFGDTFGTMNSLISGLTLLGVGIAAWLQHEELKDARKGLKDAGMERAQTLKLMADQAKLMDDQANALRAAAELSAMNSLLAHYTQQANLYRGPNPPSLLLERLATQTTRGQEFWEARRDDLVQQVQIKLAEIRTPASEFRWGPVGEDRQNWATRYCLTLLRASWLRVIACPPSERRHPEPLLNHMREHLSLVAHDLIVLGGQDGVFGTPDMILFFSVGEEFRRIVNEIDRLPPGPERGESLAQIWQEIDSVHDEANLFTYESPIW